MLKTLSAALLAVSMLAAPAMAAGVTPAKPTAPAAAGIAKPDALKARAELVRPHHRLVRHHAVRHHVSATTVATTRPQADVGAHAAPRRKALGPARSRCPSRLDREAAADLTLRRGRRSALRDRNSLCRADGLRGRLFCNRSGFGRETGFQS